MEPPAQPSLARRRMGKRAERGVPSPVRVLQERKLQKERPLESCAQEQKNKKGVTCQVERIANAIPQNRRNISSKEHLWRRPHAGSTTKINGLQSRMNAFPRKKTLKYKSPKEHVCSLDGGDNKTWPVSGSRQSQQRSTTGILQEPTTHTECIAYNASHLFRTTNTTGS